MKQFFLFLLTLFLLVGCRQSQQATEPDPYTITVQPLTLAVGPTHVAVTVLGETGRPVDNLALTLRGDMTHAGMQPVIANATNSQGGVYTVPFEWTMVGDWVLTVTFTTADGQTITRQFPYTIP